jgi:hypothetical protein
MMIDALATERHYLDHLLPVWERLPEEVKGTLYVGPRLDCRLPHVRSARVAPSDNLLLVAGFADLQRSGGRRAILMEHGAGQSYAGDPQAAKNPSYAGGGGRHNVVAFLCPNEYAARRNRAENPDRIVRVVGSPRVAELQGRMTDRSQGERPVLAVSFHWDCVACPETRSAWAHFSPGLKKLADSGQFEVLGHAHPRLFRDVEAVYRRLGIEPVESFEEVLERADVYACDNSSTMYEFAYLRGPVVVLNAPWYRLDVDHGLRFWDAAGIGPQVFEADGIAAAATFALQEPWAGADEIVERVFPGIEDPAGVAVEVCLEALAEADRMDVPGRGVARFPRTSSGLVYAARS